MTYERTTRSFGKVVSITLRIAENGYTISMSDKNSNDKNFIAEDAAGAQKVVDKFLGVKKSS